MGEVRHVSLYFRCSTVNIFVQEQLIELFKSVGQVVGFRCDASVIPSSIHAYLIDILVPFLQTRIG